MKTKNRASLLLIPLIFIVLTCYYAFAYRFSLPVDSDQVFFLRAGEEMFNGNWLLKGWYGSYLIMPTADFFWTGLLRLFVSRKVVMYFLGPAFYSALVLLSFWLIRQKQGGRSCWLILVGLLPVLFVPQIYDYYILSVGAHCIPMVYMLLLYCMLDGYEQRSKSPVWYILFFVLILISGINDQWPLYFFTIPLIIVLSIDLFMHYDRHKSILLLVSVAGLAACQVFLKLLTAFGGITTRENAISFIDLRDFLSYLISSVVTLLGTYAADFSNVSLLSLDTIRCFFGLLFLAEVIMACVWYLLHWRQSDMVSRTMIFGMLLCFGSYLLIRVYKDNPMWTIHRYFMPLFFLSIPLLGRWRMQFRMPVIKYEILLVLPLVFYSLFNISTDFRRSPHNDERLVQVAEYLNKQNVDHVYGDFWDTHALWYYSGQTIEAAPLWFTANAFRPYDWLSDQKWYQDDFNAEALVVHQGDPYGMTQEEIIKKFGEPIKHECIDRTDIYIYQRNLSQEITR